MGTMKQFVEKYGIKLSHEYADRNPYWENNTPANHYRVILRYQKRRYTLVFSMGIGIDHPPTAEEVLNCLAADAAGVDNARTFENWCGDYGYEADSRKALRTYQGCEREAANLSRLLGDKLYHELLWETESL